MDRTGAEKKGTVRPPGIDSDPPPLGPKWCSVHSITVLLYTVEYCWFYRNMKLGANEYTVESIHIISTAPAVLL